MLFKTERIRKEWDSMVAGDFPDPLVPLALYVNEMSLKIAGKPVVITMIDRTSKEQTAIIKAVNVQREALGLGPWKIGRKSVHQYWRGIDFRSWIYIEEQRDEIIRRTNKMFFYNSHFSVLAHHKNGTAGHLHGQVQAGEQWRMK